MKTLLLSLLFTSTFLFAKPCMTDIYTGNGINTTDKEAYANMKALQYFMLNKAKTSSRLDKQKYKVDYDFKFIHNPTYSFNSDMLNTFSQLKESGQISDGYFHTMFSLLAGNIPESTLHEKYIDMVSTYEEDVNSIYNKYYTSSFSQKHNVLLVAHSQGNLIGNKIYTMLDEAETKAFRMISVATPADHVMKENQISPYVTAHADLVINNVAILNHLPSNVAGTGHNFINTYLDEHSDTRHLIASYVKNAYDNLMQTTSCEEGSYSYYVWISYMCPTYSAQELVVDIYGRPTDAPYPYKKQLVTSDSRIRMPYEIIDGNEICSIYGDDRLSIWPEYDKGGCYAYSLDDNHPAGTYTLDQIANKTYDNRSSCTRYQMSSEITDSLSSMLP